MTSPALASSPAYAVELTQLEMKALWCRGAMTCEVPCPEIDADPALADSFWSALHKLQYASHRYFLPQSALPCATSL